MPIHTTHTRDAALRQLHRINRWLIAGSVVLTGAFAEAAAHAFPGKTTKTASASKVKRQAHASGSPSRTTTHRCSRPPRRRRPRPNPRPIAIRRLHRNRRRLRRNSAPEPAPAQEAAPAQESQQAEAPAPAENRRPPTNRHPPKNRLRSSPVAPEMPATDDTHRARLLRVGGARHERRAAHDRPGGARCCARGGRTGARRDRPRVQPLPGRLRAVAGERPRGSMDAASARC